MLCSLSIVVMYVKYVVYVWNVCCVRKVCTHVCTHVCVYVMYVKCVMDVLYVLCVCVYVCMLCYCVSILCVYVMYVCMNRIYDMLRYAMLC